MAVTPYRTCADPLDRLFDRLMGGGNTRSGGLMRAPET